MAENDAPKYLGNDHTISVKYLSNKQLMQEIASMAEIPEYDPSPGGENTSHRRFNKEERRRIYEAITGNSGEDYLRKQLPSEIMKEIGSDLNSNFQDEFARDDLKKIYNELSKSRD